MNILRKLFWFVIMLPLGVVLVMLLVTNRHQVEFIYNPFAPTEFAQKLELPFFYYLLGMLILGTILGSSARQTA